MSILSSASSLNPTLAWSKSNGGLGRVLIEFPLVEEWCKEQPCRKFQSFQHRKQPSGLRHEFIILNLINGGTCRIERTADPTSRFDALRSQGCIARDFVQCFRQEEAEVSFGASEIIAKVHFSRPLDILDVLRICRAVREGEKPRTYTLQVFNCFFFSLAIQSCLTRLVAKWDETIPRDRLVPGLKQAVRSSIDSYHEPITAGMRDSTSVLFRAYLLIGSSSHTLVDRNHFLQRVQSTVDHVDLHGELRNSLDSVLWYHDLPVELCRLAQKMTKSAWLQPLIVGFIMRVPANNSPPPLSANNTPASRTPLPHVPTQESLEPLKQNCMTVLMDLVEKVDRTTGITSTRRRALRPITSQYHQLAGPSMTANPDHHRDHTYKQANLKSLTVVEWTLILWTHVKNLPRYIFYLLWWLLGSLLLGLDSQHDRCIPIEEELERMIFRLEGLERIERQDWVNLLCALEALRDNPYAIWNKYPWAQVSQEANHTLFNSGMGAEKSVLQVSFNESSGYNESTVSEFQVYISERIRFQAELIQKVWLGSSTYIETELQNTLSHVWASIRSDEHIMAYGYTGGDGPNPDNDPNPDDNPMAEDNPIIGHDPSAHDDPVPGDEPTRGDGPARDDDPTLGDRPTGGGGPMGGSGPARGDNSRPGDESTGGNRPTEGNRPARDDGPPRGNDPTAGEDPRTRSSLLSASLAVSGVVGFSLGLQRVLQAPGGSVASTSSRTPEPQAPLGASQNATGGFAISAGRPTSLVPEVRQLLPLFSRPYPCQQLGYSGYRDLLNTWSTRIRIPNIQFRTGMTIDEHGRQMWEAVPIFPKIYLPPEPLDQPFVGHGRSKHEAQAASIHALRNASWPNEEIQLVRWDFVDDGRIYTAVPHHYGSPALLEDPDVVGVGSTKASAVERSARGLLLSEYYCVTW